MKGQSFTTAEAPKDNQACNLCQETIMEVEGCGVNIHNDQTEKKQDVPFNTTIDVRKGIFCSGLQNLR